MPSKHWLAKSEPETYSIHDLARDGQTHWEGVRNYMARNYLRDMQVGDLVLFYHSNAEPSGVAGIARVERAAYPDLTALDPRSPYYDEGATEADPRWSMVDVAHVETWPRVVALEELKADPELAGMEVTRKGSRLSVTPVSEAHYQRVVALAAAAPRVASTEATRKKAGAKVPTVGAAKKAAGAAKKSAAKKSAAKKSAAKKGAAKKGAAKKGAAKKGAANKGAPRKNAAPQKPARAAAPAPKPSRRAARRGRAET